MRKVKKLLVVALVVFTGPLIGCDAHKDERALLEKQISEKDANLVHQNEQRSGIATAIQTLTSEIKSSADSLPQHSQRRAKLQDDLSSFVLDHKLATVAVIAAGGAAATFVDSNIDEDTKNMLRVIGVVGAIYCISNSDECADVTARVLYFGSQIETENKTIDETTSGLASMKTSLQARQKELASIEAAISTQQSEREAIKQKHDSLVCRLCF